MDFRKITNDMKQDKLLNLYLFYGSEVFLINNILKKIEEKYINDINKNFNLVLLQGENLVIDELINLCETSPFLGDKKLVIVKDSNLFSSNKAKDADSEEELIKYFSNISPDTILIFVEGQSIDKRKKIVKEVKKYGEIIEFVKLERRDLGKWIQDYFRKNNKTMNDRTLSYFIEVIGYEDRNSDKTLYDIENEMKKLCNYIGTNTQIKEEDIDKIISKPIENNIFTLVDAVAEKNSDLALRMLSQLLISGEPEVKILHMVVRQFKLLNNIKIMIDKGYTTMAISPKFSLPNYIIKKNVKQSNFFSSIQLLKILNIALETDRNIKTGKMNPKLALEVFCVRCCNI